MIKSHVRPNLRVEYIALTVYEDIHNNRGILSIIIFVLYIEKLRNNVFIAY